MSRREAVFWCLLLVGLYLPFVGRPAHLDGGFLLRNAQAALEQPFSPYHGSVDFIGYRWPRRFWTHPPLLWYWLAPVVAWLPSSWHAVGAHLALLPFTLLLIPALALLGRFGPGLAGRAFILTSPLLAVVAHTISWEMPVLACNLLAVGLMVHAADRGRRRALLWAAIPAGMALLIAYPGRIPLILLFMAWRLRVPWRWTVTLLGLTLLPLALFEGVTAWTWGVPHFLEATLSDRVPISYAAISVPWGISLANLLAELGALPLAAALIPALWRWPGTTAVCLGLGAAVAWFCPSPSLLISIQLAAWCGLGFLTLAYASRHVVGQLRKAGWPAKRLPDPEVLWGASLALEMAFAATMLVHGSARYIVPLVVPAAFFVDRWWAEWGLPRRALVVVVGVQVAAALLLSWAEQAEVEAYASAPAELALSAPPDGRTYFIGEWGFRTAMKAAGYRYLYRDTLPGLGDTLIRPRRLAREVWVINRHLEEGLDLVRTAVIPLSHGLPIHVDRPASYAGFWWSGSGLLPFTWGQGPVDELEIYRLQTLPPLLDAYRLWRAMVKSGEAKDPRPSAHQWITDRFGDGLPRTTLFLHPPARIHWELGAGRGRLDLGVGFHPNAGPGDGGEVLVTLRQPGRKDTEVLGRIPLIAGQWTITNMMVETPAPGAVLTLESHSGPNGDLQYDWFCLRPVFRGPDSPSVRRAWITLPPAIEAKIPGSNP